MLKIIDPHLHLFTLKQGKYQWLKSDSPPLWADKKLIQKDFGEADLQLSLPNHLYGFVHIEAGFDNRQPWREIDWLEGHCTLPFKSVAFADITANTFSQHIHLLRQYQSVVGIRHILDEDAFEILSASSIHQAFELLQNFNLSFDAQLDLTDSRSTEQLVSLAERYSQLKIIINHGGWPPSHGVSSDYQRWQENTQKLAEQHNVAMKLSGWEMSDRNWQLHHATPIIDHCLKVFGNERVMLASNFPLCTFSHTYEELWKIYTSLEVINRHVFQKITYSNAATWYQFDLEASDTD